MKSRIDAFWQEICDLETEYEMYLVHGKEGSILINSDSDVIATVSTSGELKVLNDDEFAQANRRALVTGKFGI